MMQSLERPRGIAATVAAILIAGLATHASAAVLCGRRNAATGHHARRLRRSLTRSDRERIGARAPVAPLC
jgi:hypothetical protein